MAYENDIITGEVVDLKVKGYPEGSWKYKPVDGGTELDWLPKYIYVEDGKPKHDYTKLNHLKLQNIVETPYERELIKKSIGVDKDFKYLSEDDKVKFLRKLKGPILDKILNAIDSYNNGDSEVKKD